MGHLVSLSSAQGLVLRAPLAKGDIRDSALLDLPIQTGNLVLDCGFQLCRSFHEPLVARMLPLANTPKFFHRGVFRFGNHGECQVIA